MSNLTKNEEIILLSILRLKDNAYGVSIKNQIKKLTGGLLIKREGMPVPERGGRRKIYYSISQSGKRALEEAYELKEALWDGIGIPTLKKGEAR